MQVSIGAEESDAPTPRVARPARPAAVQIDPSAQQPGRLIQAVVADAFQKDREFRRYGHNSSLTKSTGLVDYFFAVGDEPRHPDDVFGRLRWGGQFAYASRDRREVELLARHFGQRGYAILRQPTPVRLPWLGMRLPWLGTRAHYFIARKIYLTLPREITERFTYHLQLVPDEAPGGGWIVRKEVPSLERVMARLRARFSDMPDAALEKRARKFTDKIFPLFLTREAAMLQILARELPPDYRSRVPRPLKLEQDGKGYVHKLWMNWLRMSAPTGGPLTQLDYARQSADLLRAIHDVARVIHLDLRPDNVVITDKGVCFVDFGSAVRVGENIQGNPMLATIFDELMRTSQIQRMLRQMTRSGAVTSKIISDAYQRVDKAVDLFYLAVQMNNPLANPDFAGLVTLDPQSESAKALATFTHDVLKPVDPAHPVIRSAAELLAGIDRIAKRAND